MNYQKIYDSLIERGKNRILEGYSENHHIVPKCLSGSNDKENLVRLTGREHFIAHLLLVKTNPGNRGLLFALILMLGKLDGGKRITGRTYEILRKKYSKSISGKNNPNFGKGLFGKNHPMYGHIYTEKTLQKMSQNHADVSGKNNPMYGHVYTEKTLQKMRKPKTEEHIKNIRNSQGIPILCTTNGISYRSARGAARQLGLHQSNITAVLKNKLLNTKGYKFEYVRNI